MLKNTNVWYGKCKQCCVLLLRQRNSNSILDFRERRRLYTCIYMYVFWMILRRREKRGQCGRVSLGVRCRVYGLECRGHRPNASCTQDRSQTQNWVLPDTRTGPFLRSVLDSFIHSGALLFTPFSFSLFPSFVIYVIGESLTAYVLSFK